MVLLWPKDPVRLTVRLSELQATYLSMSVRLFGLRPSKSVLCVFSVLTLSPLTDPLGPCFNTLQALNRSKIETLMLLTFGNSRYGTSATLTDMGLLLT